MIPARSRTPALVASLLTALACTTAVACSSRAPGGPGDHDAGPGDGALLDGGGGDGRGRDAAEGGRGGDGGPDAAHEAGQRDASGASDAGELGDGACPGFVESAKIALPHIGNGLVAADMDQDGRTDLVVSFETATTGIAVFLNKGGGKFDPEADYPSPYAGLFTVADFNGDGFPDVAVEADPPPAFIPQISILFNNKDGTLGAPQVLEVRNEVHAIVAGDWNGDHALDLAVTNGFVSTDGGALGVLALFTNDGAGNFTEAAAAAQTIYPPLATADMDGDGKPDILGEGFQVSPAVGVLTHAGSGFVQNDYGVVYGVGSLAVADLDHDGQLDVALVAASVATDNQVQLLYGTGGGALGSDTLLAGAASGIQTQTVDALDLNGDGLYELIVTTANGTNPFSATVMMNTGSRSFDAHLGAITGPVGDFATATAVADYDGNHRPDFAYMLLGDQAVHVALNTCP